MSACAVTAALDGVISVKELVALILMYARTERIIVITPDFTTFPFAIEQRTIMIRHADAQISFGVPTAAATGAVSKAPATAAAAASTASASTWHVPADDVCRVAPTVEGWRAAATPSASASVPKARSRIQFGLAVADQHLVLCGGGLYEHESVPPFVVFDTVRALDISASHRLEPDGKRRFRGAATGDTGRDGPTAWFVAEPMTVARSGFAIASVNDCVYVFGGHARDKKIDGRANVHFGVQQSYTIAPTDRAECWSVKETWTDLPPLPKARADCVAVVLHHLIFIFNTGFCADLKLRIDCFDTKTQTYTRIENPPLPDREHATYVACPNMTVRGQRIAAGAATSSGAPAALTGCILLIGGEHAEVTVIPGCGQVVLGGINGNRNDNNSTTREVLAFDPFGTQKWTLFPYALEHARSSAAACVTSDGRVWCAGGEVRAPDSWEADDVGAGGTDMPEWEKRRTVEVFEPHAAPPAGDAATAPTTQLGWRMCAELLPRGGVGLTALVSTSAL